MRAPFIFRHPSTWPDWLSSPTFFAAITAIHVVGLVALLTIIAMGGVA